MSGFALYVIALLSGLLVAFAAWLWHLKIKNAGVIDIVWGLNLALMAVLYAILAEGWAPRQWTVAGMVVFTGLRLSYHLATRVLGHPEEGRYVALRQKWGAPIELKFLAFFLFQAVLASWLSMPYFAAAQNSEPGWTFLEYLGIVIFGVGFLGESIADRQLKAFKADVSNRGKTCRRGLWKFSRHPNYFFEWTMWLAYFIIASASPWGWTTIFAPALMLHVLLNVTGVKITEEQCLRTRGEDYRHYQATTSAFVPWFPKRVRDDRQFVDVDPAA